MVNPQLSFRKHGFFKLSVAAALLLLFGLQISSQGQTTAFTYQGRLNDGAAPANGIYDLRFTVYNTLSGGSVSGGPVTNAATTVVNGLFTVTLDFGPGVFTGAGRWLEMSVRTNAGGTFSDLAPRQSITATPYAIQAATAGSATTAASANSVAAGNISGTIALTQLPGNLLTNNATTAALTGSFSGNGAGLTNLNANNLTGTLSDARLSANVPLLNGTNVFSGTNRFSNMMLATNANNQMSGTFTGNGAGLTNLSTAAISSGTLPDSRLSTNVALRAGGNLFSGSQEVSDSVIIGAATLDSQQPTSDTVVGGTDHWQSFTTTKSGALTSVALKISSPLGIPSSCTLRIYAGEGTNGSLLASQSLMLSPGPGAFVTNALTAAPAVLLGNQYTIAISVPSAPSVWLALSSNGSYGSGRSDVSPNSDFPFATFIALTAPNTSILMVNPPGASGFVGVGTTTPQAKLHVAGDIRADGVLTGNGSGLTTLNPQNLSGVLPDIKLSGNVPLLNATQVFSGKVVFNNPNSIFNGDGAGLTNLQNLDASKLTSGTLADGRHSTNVALRAGGNIFSGSQVIADTVISGAAVVDQQQLLSSGVGGGPDQWQSFTAGTNGFLTAVAISVSSPAGASSVPGIISIYAGEGTSGALLATQSVTWTSGYAYQSNSFDLPPFLNTGNQYTIRFVALSGASPWVSIRTTDDYAGGRSSIAPFADYLFKTYMSPQAVGTILMVNPPGNLGYVGIGTNSPRAKLHVAGDILANGIITGNGAGLTSLSASNLSGPLADARLSTNVALLNATNIFSGVVLASNVNNQLIGLFSGNGNGLTNLNATNLTGNVPSASLSSVPAASLTGTVVDARLSANVALLNASQTFTGIPTFSNTVNIASNNFLKFGAGVPGQEANAGKIGYQTFTPGALDIIGAGTNNTSSRSIRFWAEAGSIFSGPVTATTFSGNGSALTSLNGTNLQDGTVTAAKLGGVLTASQIPNIDASKVNSGLLADAQLTTNVALRAGGNIFSGGQQVLDTVVSGTQFLDQQQTLVVGGTGAADQWQSFTAGTNGFLSAVALKVGSPLGASPSPGTIRIYSGEGTAGTLLSSQSVTWAVTSGSFQTNTLTLPPYLTNGSKYTIRFGAPSASFGWVDIGNDYYLTGRSDIGLSDYCFMTFMKQAAFGAPILSVNPVGNSGFVGIGTNAPQAKLHVVGDILAEGNLRTTGTIIGNGAAMTNLNAANLAGSIPPASLTAVPASSLTGTVPDALLSNNIARLTAGKISDTLLSANVALLDDTNTFTGTNFFTKAIALGANPPLGRLEIEAGADSSGSADGKAISLAWHGGGYRHFIRSRHDAAVGNGNGIDFFVNTNSTAGGSTAPGTGNVFVATMSGTGFLGVGTTTPTNKLHVVGGATFSSGSAGANQNVVWAPGSGSWSFTSDRNTKERLQPVDSQSVLERVAKLPIAEWNYIGYEQRHIGPMAQDFHAQFPLNPSDTTLNDADLHGVALAAIQGLNQKLEQKDSEITELKSRLDRMERLLNGKQN